MSDLDLHERLDAFIKYVEDNKKHENFQLLLSYLIDLKNDDLPEWVTHEAEKEKNKN